MEYPYTSLSSTSGYWFFSCEDGEGSLRDSGFDRTSHQLTEGNFTIPLRSPRHWAKHRASHHPQSIEPPFQREVLPGVVSTGISALQIGWGVDHRHLPLIMYAKKQYRASQVIFGMDTSQYYLFAVLGPHVLPWQHSLYMDYISPTSKPENWSFVLERF